MPKAARGGSLGTELGLFAKIVKPTRVNFAIIIVEPILRNSQRQQEFSVFELHLLTRIFNSSQSIHHG
jgi:hypothetical protein